MKLQILSSCPHCGQTSREAFAVDRDFVTDLIVNGETVVEDLNAVPRSEVVLGLNTPDRTLCPCAHVVLINVLAFSVDDDYPQRAGTRAYEATWHHPAFASQFDAAIAEELKTRLLNKNPSGSAVVGEFGRDFFDLGYHAEGEEEHGDEKIEFEVHASVLYAPDPAAFLIAYNWLVREFACPCGAHGWPAEGSGVRLSDGVLLNLHANGEAQDELAG